MLKSKSFQYILLSVCLFCVICIFYIFVNIWGMSAQNKSSIQDSAVTTTLIVGVDVNNTAKVTFEQEPNEIKKITYNGKDYLGYVVTRNYNSFEEFSSKIISNVEQNDIFSGIVIREDIGTKYATYTFEAVVNKFELVADNTESLLIYEITMPGALHMYNSGIQGNDNKTVSIDLLNSQTSVIKIESIVISPYANYYQSLFVISIILIVTVILLLMSYISYSRYQLSRLK